MTPSFRLRLRQIWLMNKNKAELSEIVQAAPPLNIKPIILIA